MKKQLKINWGDEVHLPNGQIIQPRMLSPEESRELNTRFMPAWQREFNDGKRDGYKKAMESGTWDNDNMSVIRLTPEGWVCDGGHRTSAAEKAGFTLCAVVIKNVPAKTFLTTDTQKTRAAGVFIAGVNNKLLTTLAETFLRANCGMSPIAQSGVGSAAFAMNANDPAAFLHANRLTLENLAAIAMRMRPRCKDAVTTKIWAVVAAIAHAKAGRDMGDDWVDSLKNNSPAIVDIKDYVSKCRKRTQSQRLSSSAVASWVFCRLMSDFQEKCLGGPKWNPRQVPRIMDRFAHALRGCFKMPTPADYEGAAEDLFKYAEQIHDADKNSRGTFGDYFDSQLTSNRRNA